jgi:hypothetical protein
MDAAGGLGRAPWQASTLTRRRNRLLPLRVLTKASSSHARPRRAPLLPPSGAEPPGAADPPDEFYEFTADDFLVVARAAQRRAETDAVFLTRSAREAAARARAEALPPVPVRLHFPDGSIVQV